MEETRGRSNARLRIEGFSVALLAVALAVPFLGGVASAASTATDDASDAAYDDGWQNGDDGGSGWSGGWELVSYTGNPGSAASHTVASSSGNGGTTDIDTGGRSFRLAASGGGEAVALRSLAGDLAVGEVIRADLDVAPLAGGLGSLILGTLGPARLVVGASDTFYYVVDNTGSHSLGIPIDGERIHVEITRTGTDTYSLEATPAAGSPVTRDGTMTGTGAIDRISFDVYAPNAAERTLYFNRVAVPELGGTLSAAAPAVGLALLRVWRRRRRAN